MAYQTFVFVGDTNIGSRISQSLIEGGFSSASSLSDADVVFTYYETQQGLEDLYFDSAGLLQDTKEGVLLVDLSPTTPSFARELYAVASVNDRSTLDAPLVVRDIVDEDAFASKDNLLLFVGGEEQNFDNAKGMLHAIARHVLYLGEAGCGQAAKIMATLQRASALIGVIESYAAFKNSEVSYDAEEVMDTLASAGCVSPVNIAYIDAIRNKDFAGSYSVEILMAELVAALSAADDRDHVLPQAESGFRLLELLAMVGGAQYNPAALALIFEDEKAAERFGLDWSRAAGAYEEHDHDHGHDCDCGHDHGHDHDHDRDYGEDDYFDPDGFAGLGGISAN
ncbi:NAD(P)-binding domain-containing protein [Anaerotardibacter muris]|uniref:NAD(P)-binding domain-containing protein n=1 Tax=Anaerotardibacter muris TaxID=2941505 RepID=UPI00203C58E0|nr:NAD(P)-binding domain-containing protein [Anaerotardibacter muris]